MMLSVEQVSISKRDKKIIDNVTLSIREGEWYALVGQSGAENPCSPGHRQMLPNLRVEGNIHYKEINLLSLLPKQMRTVRGSKLSYIFQDYQGSFTPFRTIGQHFEEYQKAHGISDSKTRLLSAFAHLIPSG